MTPSPIDPSDTEHLPEKVREVIAKCNAEHAVQERHFLIGHRYATIDDVRILVNALIASQKELEDVRLELKMVRTRVKDLENLLDRMSGSWRTFGDAP